MSYSQTQLRPKPESGRRPASMTDITLDKNQNKAQAQLNMPPTHSQVQALVKYYEQVQIEAQNQAQTNTQNTDQSHDKVKLIIRAI